MTDGANLSLEPGQGLSGYRDVQRVSDLQLVDASDNPMYTTIEHVELMARELQERRAKDLTPEQMEHLRVLADVVRLGLNEVNAYENPKDEYEEILRNTHLKLRLGLIALEGWLGMQG